jgi:hypothetical protein
MGDLSVLAEPFVAGGDAAVVVCIATRAARHRERAISTLALPGDSSFAPGAAQLVRTRQGAPLPETLPRRACASALNAAAPAR